MEILGLYDENGNFLNKSIERGVKTFSDGEYIRIVTIWIIDENNKFLIQLAGGNRKREWATTGGHIQFGQTPISAAICEVREELGIILEESKLEYLGFILHKPAIFDAFLIRGNYNIEDLTLQAEEVAEVKLASANEIIELIEDNEFRKSHSLVFEKFLLNKN